MDGNENLGAEPNTTPVAGKPHGKQCIAVGMARW